MQEQPGYTIILHHHGIKPWPLMIPSGSAKARTTPVRLTDALLSIEPLWVLAATTLVYLSYLLNASAILPWVGIALAYAPFLARLTRREYPIRGTPFDIPMALLMIGAVIGCFSAPNRAIGLGALQCMLVTCLFYYSLVNYKHPASLTKWLIMLTPVAFLIVLVLFVFDLPGVSSQPNLVIGGSGTHHGLAMYLAILAAALLGIGLFARNTRARLLAAGVLLAAVIIVIVMTSESLTRLVQLTSIRGRWPLWENTAALLSDSPLTGLGLGCWAMAYYGTPVINTELVGGTTHAHNAYLELYANTGILGVLALVIALVVGAKLSLDIIRSPRHHPWYGFGVGMILACVTTMVVGTLESAPAGVPLVATETYYYIVSPIPWILCGLLVIAHRLVTEEARPPLPVPRGGEPGSSPESAS
ncbi:MAG: O-antigen ligase family protein [Dehalococcoidia bacterium]|nr:O-antigen ligase family protein [Dehalococcoidia bacterium]